MSSSVPDLWHERTNHLTLDQLGFSTSPSTNPASSMNTRKHNDNNQKKAPLDHSGQLAEKMLAGWTLLGTCCQSCLLPLVRNHKREMYCVKCEAWTSASGQPLLPKEEEEEEMEEPEVEVMTKGSKSPELLLSDQDILPAAYV